jgi:GNAT superfamily N-acetyltransferase
VRHYVEGIDLSRDAVFVVTDVNLATIGAAHIAREDGHAQLGISVLPQSRRRGIGGGLLARCTARARNWGMRVMFMNCLVENAAMMHLARKQGLKIAVSGAEAEAFVQLPRADLTSLAAEKPNSRPYADRRVERCLICLGWAARYGTRRWRARNYEMASLPASVIS